MDGETITLPGVYRLQWDCVPNDQLQGVAEELQALLLDSDKANTYYALPQFPFAILQFTAERLSRPFVITSRRRAHITSAYSEELSAHARLSRTEYLSLVSLLALTQLRTLSLNEYLEAEDMLYTCHPACVFTSPANLQDFGLVLEQKQVCGGCVDFYSTLGAEREIASVLAFTRR